MTSKVKKLLSHEGILFFLSNLVYSFSTYLIAIIIPYKLNTYLMAEFSAGFNILMLLIFVFEFGLTISFLRYSQIYHIANYLNAFFQMFVFALILLFAFTAFSGPIDRLFGLSNLEIEKIYVYISVVMLLSWILFKNTLLAKKNIKSIIIHSFIILGLRIIFLSYIMMSATIMINDVFIYLFIIPFLIVLLFNLKENLLLLYQALFSLSDKRVIIVFFRKAKRYISYSIVTYIIGALYIYTGRYVIIYLSNHDEHALLAELGYAISFLGLILIFIASARTYFISKYNIGDIENILNYINKLKSYQSIFIIAAVLISAAIAFLVYFIKPGYLSYASSIYVFMLIFSYTLIAFYSLFTLLSKTFNYNMLELGLNIIRLLLVIAVTHLIFSQNPMWGFLIISIIMVSIEYIFAKIVITRVTKKGNNNEGN